MRPSPQRERVFGFTSPVSQTISLIPTPVPVTYNRAMRCRFMGYVVLVALGLQSGCQLILGIDAPVPRDGNGLSDPKEMCKTWEPVHFAPCDVASPGEELVLQRSQYRYDTDLGELDDGQVQIAHVNEIISSEYGEIMLISVQSFHIAPNAELRVVGSRPLLIASWDRIEIAGGLDVSSSPSDMGAGSRDDCSGAPGDPATRGSGGGGGGGFGGVGGAGGQGDNGDIAGGDGGARIDPPLFPRGGCAGGSSGRNAGNPARAGGPGGGAVQLTARNHITISGWINAGGAGGMGGVLEGGGSGGGAGGMIGLHAPEIQLQRRAILSANGGGGGGGSDNNDGMGENGEPGVDGQRSTEAAPGGAGGKPNMSGGGGDGGNGGHRESPDGAPAEMGNILDGGGGGGGSVGYIIAQSSSAIEVNDDAMISPPIRTP